MGLGFVVLHYFIQGVLIGKPVHVGIALPLSCDFEWWFYDNYIVT